MKKKFITLAAAMTLAFSWSITASAQPAAMPDGAMFDAEYYAQANPDVVAAFGTDANMLYLHYTQFGKAEGRAATNPATNQGNVDSIGGFDAEYYAQANPDVVAVFGTDANMLYLHYVQFGKAEGRAATNPAATNPAAASTAATNPATTQDHVDSLEEFNAEYYMRANDDVLQAVGMDRAALYQHYIQHGRTEGRLYNSRTKEEVTNELIQKYGLHVWNDFGDWFVYLGTSFNDIPPSGYKAQTDAILNRYRGTASSIITVEPSEGTGGETLYSDSVYAWFVYKRPVPQGVKEFILNYGTPGLFYNHGYDYYFDASEIHWVQN